MTVEQFILIHVPSPLLGVGCVLLATALAVGGLLLVRRNVALSTLESHNDVAGFIIAVIGAIYAVLLAFVVIIVWEQFDQAAANADHEAAVVSQLHRSAEALSAGAPLHASLQRYAESVAEREWDTMAEGKGESRDTDQALDLLWTTFQKTAVTPQEAVFQDQFLDRLSDLEEARRDRLLDAETALPNPLWATLICGAMITVAFTYFFGVTNVRAQMLMVAALSATIGLALFLILSLDYPFSGSVSVKPTAMREAITEFIQRG